LFALSPNAFSIFGTNNILMRATLLLTVLIFSLGSSAQYYYKDIIGTKESADIVRSYLKNKVTRVVLTSFDGTNQKDEDFYIEQQFSSADNSLRTIARSNTSKPSSLVSYFDANGNITRTVDSSNLVISWTEYQYNATGQLVKVNSSSSDSARTTDLMVEFHRNLLRRESGNKLMSKSEALRLAAMKLLHGKYNHPAYWAVFVLSGSDR